MFSKKRGQSIVEVVVALSILTIVLTGIVTLIVDVVNLTLLSRSKTEAIAMAESGLAKAMLQVKNGCSVANSYNFDAIKAELNTRADGKRIDLVDSDLSGPSEANDSLGLNSTNFRKIVARVTWIERRYGNQVYELSQIVESK